MSKNRSIHSQGRRLRIGLIDVDGGRFPNLALMKIAAYHRLRGDDVEWYMGLSRYDIVYMSKIFNFTKDYAYHINAESVVKGGTGYDIHSLLPPYIDDCIPDYSIYPNIDKHTAYGFITRGCQNKCRWCVVPEKEGSIRPYRDVDDIATDGRYKLILMDNNILASDYGFNQIDKIISKGYHVDFNQALDARLISSAVAEKLANIKWLAPIRLGCDTIQQIRYCQEAMRLIDSYRDIPARYMLYTMIDGDIEENYYRLSFFRNNSRVRISAQPFRNPHIINTVPQWQRDMARWAMRRELYASFDFKDFQARKGFSCAQYFK